MTDEDEQNDRAMLTTTKKRDSLFANEDATIRACMTVHVCCKFRNLIFSHSPIVMSAQKSRPSEVVNQFSLDAHDRHEMPSTATSTLYEMCLAAPNPLFLSIISHNHVDDRQTSSSIGWLDVIPPFHSINLEISDCCLRCREFNVDDGRMRSIINHSGELRRKFKQFFITIF